MHDEEKENNAFWSFVIITGIMIFVNIAVCIWSNIKVHELMSNDTSIPAIRYAKEAISTLLLGAIVSIPVDVLSWIIPKTNIVKIYGILENTLYKVICLVMAVALNVITFSNGVSPFIAAKDLLPKSGHSIFDMIVPWL